MVHITHPPEWIQSRLDAIAAARANGDVFVHSSVQTGDRILLLIEAPAGQDEASSLSLAATGLQAKATALQVAVTPVEVGPINVLK